MGKSTQSDKELSDIPNQLQTHHWFEIYDSIWKRESWEMEAHLQIQSKL